MFMGLHVMAARMYTGRTTPCFPGYCSCVNSISFSLLGIVTGSLPRGDFTPKRRSVKASAYIWPGMKGSRMLFTLSSQGRSTAPGDTAATTMFAQRFHYEASVQRSVWRRDYWQFREACSHFEHGVSSKMSESMVRPNGKRSPPKL